MRDEQQKCILCLTPGLRLCDSCLIDVEKVSLGESSLVGKLISRIEKLEKESAEQLAYIEGLSEAIDMIRGHLVI